MVTQDTARALAELNARIESCRLCPRLVAWREEVARAKRASFRDQEYWARPVTGFGDPEAGLLVLGLAPAAHGGNRTGRIFTGDRSGEWVFRALHETGFSPRPASLSRDDGLELEGAYLAAAVRCAPPANRPTREELERCLPYLVEEMGLLGRVRVVLCLGAVAWETAWRALARLGLPTPRPRPSFRHGAEVRIGPYTLLASYHPSQRNTFTGTLTAEMFRERFSRAREILEKMGQR
jgi:uracil-DNA glycosylase family 4